MPPDQEHQDEKTIDTAWTSPDGQFIAASGQGRSIYVWNAASRFSTVASGGRDVVILSTEKTVNGRDEYRQLSVWATPLA